LAMGLNEFAGYLAVAFVALATALLAARYGLRPVPFELGAAIAACGFIVSLAFVKETKAHAEGESAVTPGDPRGMPFSKVFARATVSDPTLSACSQAGCVNNLNDGMVWGLLPLMAATAGFSFSGVGVLAATYPFVWGALQGFTGALSDTLGRKWMIVAGMFLQAGGIGLLLVTAGFAWWLVAAVVLGIGTAMVYPTLLAAIGDVAHPSWRASAFGVYRFWRDAGYAAGALGAGIVADLFGAPAAVGLVALLTFASGVVVAVRMRETAGPAPSTSTA
jgi:MFS family permease